MKKPQDDKEAVKFQRLYAEKGVVNAQFRLAQMYYEGQGVEQDYKEAVKWFRLAAEQGDAEAQYEVGVMYYKGEGVPKDYVLAHMWANLAASSGDKNAIEGRETTYESWGQVASFYST